MLQIQHPSSLRRHESIAFASRLAAGCKDLGKGHDRNELAGMPAARKNDCPAKQARAGSGSTPDRATDLGQSSVDPLSTSNADWYTAACIDRNGHPVPGAYLPAGSCDARRDSALRPSARLRVAAEIASVSEQRRLRQPRFADPRGRRPSHRSSHPRHMCERPKPRQQDGLSGTARSCVPQHEITESRTA
jgi:hypothetical protein